MPQPYTQNPNGIFMPGYGWMSWQVYQQTFGGGTDPGIEPGALPSPPPAPRGSGGVYGPGGPMPPAPSPTEPPTIDYSQYPRDPNPGASVYTPTANLYPPGYEPSSPIGGGGSPPVYSPPYIGQSIPSWTPEGNLWTSGPTGETGPAATPAPTPYGVPFELGGTPAPAFNEPTPIPGQQEPGSFSGNVPFSDWNYSPAPGGGYYLYDNNWNYVGEVPPGNNSPQPPPDIGNYAANPNLFYGYGQPSGSGPTDQIPQPAGMTDLVPPPSLPGLPPDTGGMVAGGQPQTPFYGPTSGAFIDPTTGMFVMPGTPVNQGGGGGYWGSGGTQTYYPSGPNFGGALGGANIGSFGMSGEAQMPFGGGLGGNPVLLAAQAGYPNYFADYAGGDITQAGGGLHEGSFRSPTTIR